MKNATPNNFTTIVAQKQTKGKGQQESNWFSEPNKNLTFSVFVSHENLKITHQKSLNFAISLLLATEQLSLLLSKETFIVENVGGS